MTAPKYPPRKRPGNPVGKTGRKYTLYLPAESQALLERLLLSLADGNGYRLSISGMVQRGLEALAKAEGVERDNP